MNNSAITSTVDNSFAASDDFHTVKIHNSRGRALKKFFDIRLAWGTHVAKIRRTYSSQIMLTCSFLLWSGSWPCPWVFHAFFVFIHFQPLKYNPNKYAILLSEFVSSFYRRSLLRSINFEVIWRDYFHFF